MKFAFDYLNPDQYDQRKLSVNCSRKEKRRKLSAHIKKSSISLLPFRPRKFYQ